MSPRQQGATGGVGAAARARLTERPAPDDLGSRALGAARRRRRARRAWALSVPLTVAALVATGLLVPRADTPGAGSGTALAVGPLGGRALGGGAVGGVPASALLPLGAVRSLLPGARVGTPPTDFSGVLSPGGYCLDVPLEGVPAPTSAWAGEWTQDAAGADVVDEAGSVREEVLLWPSAAAASAYTRRVRESPTTCRDPRDAAFPGTVYTPLALDARSGAADAPRTADDTGGPLMSLATARAGASVPGTPVWRVRAVFARGATAVSLTAVVRAPDEGRAARAARDLLDVALERAVAAGRAADPGPGPDGTDDTDPGAALVSAGQAP